MLRLIDHEMDHVDQKVNLMMEDHNEREFLAYYHSYMRSTPLLPAVDQYVNNFFVFSAITYYWRMPAAQQVQYLSQYFSLIGH